MLGNAKDILIVNNLCWVPAPVPLVSKGKLGLTWSNSKLEGTQNTAYTLEIGKQQMRACKLSKLNVVPGQLPTFYCPAVTVW